MYGELLRKFSVSSYKAISQRRFDDVMAFLNGWQFGFKANWVKETVHPQIKGLTTYLLGWVEVTNLIYP